MLSASLNKAFPFAGSLSGTGKKKGGVSKGGTACTGGYKGVQTVRPESVAGGGCLRCYEIGMSRRIKPKEKYVHISMKKVWHNLDGPSKNKELWSYVVSFEFSRPKVSQMEPSRC